MSFCPQLSAAFFTSAQHVMAFIYTYEYFFNTVYELMRKEQFLGHTFPQISIHQRIYEDFIHVKLFWKWLNDET